MAENDLLPGHKLVFDRELQQYIQVPLEPGERVGIRERLPQAEGYEYPEGMSFFPFRRKQSEWKGIPYAPVPDAPLELTLPGFARTMLNDLWLAFTGPGRAAAGEFTQNELEEVGIRAGSAIGWSSYGVPRPRGSMGMSGFAKKPPASSETPKLSDIDNLYNEFNAVYEVVQPKMNNKGVYIAYDDVAGEHYPVDANGKAIVINPDDAVYEAFAKLNEKWNTYADAESNVEFQKYGVQGKPKSSEFSPKEKEVYSSSLKEFEKVYDEAEKELAYWGDYKLDLAPDGGYVVKYKDYSKSVEYDPASPIGEIMSNLQAAANKYDAAIKGVESSPKSALDEFNETYASAQAKLAADKWDQLTIGTDENTGDFIIAWKNTGDNFHPMSEELTGILRDLNEAKAKYVSSAGEQQPMPGVKKAPAPSENELGAAKPNPMLPSLFELKHQIQEYLQNQGWDDLILDKDADGVFKLFTESGNEFTVSEGGKLGELMHNLNKNFGSVPSKKKGKLFGVKDAPPSYLEQMPPESMREYTPSELDWEYQREYVELSKGLFPNAFKDRADFQQQYDAAPLRVLTLKELKNLEYATLGGVLGTGRSQEKMIQNVMDVAGHRRDVPKIMEAIKSGQTAPPIVLRHDDGMRILGGNTRLMSALALGKNMPVKVIDIRSLPRRGSHRFDTSEPLTQEARAANFNRWFEGSKVVDYEGNPMIFFHSTDAPNIEAIDMDMVYKKSGGSRNFLSTTGSTKFANKWAAGENQTIYPVYVSAKNPGDFRKPEHVKMAAEWKTQQELEHYGWTPEQVKRARDKVRVPKPVLIEGDDVKKFRSTFEDQLERAESGIWTFWEDPKMWKHFGWDGAFMKENPGDDALNFAAPQPGQVKSIFNKGWWNPEDPRILYSGGAPLPLDLEPVDYDPFELEPVSGDPFAVEEKK